MTFGQIILVEPDVKVFRRRCMMFALARSSMVIVGELGGIVRLCWGTHAKLTMTTRLVNRAPSLNVAPWKSIALVQTWNMATEASSGINMTLTVVVESNAQKPVLAWVSRFCASERDLTSPPYQE